MLAGREMLMRRGLAILIFCASVSAIGAGAAPAAKKTPTPSAPVRWTVSLPRKGSEELLRAVSEANGR